MARDGDRDVAMHHGTDQLRRLQATFPRCGRDGVRSQQCVDATLGDDMRLQAQRVRFQDNIERNTLLRTDRFQLIAPAVWAAEKYERPIVQGQKGTVAREVSGSPAALTR